MPVLDTLELDYETFSEDDLEDAGTDRYTASKSTRPLMAAFAINEGAWVHWEAHKAPVPRILREALMDSSVQKWAFNAQFERLTTNRVLKIPSPIKNWRCTMVLAYLQSFFGGLDKVGKQIGLEQEKQKLTTGKSLINLFCMPQNVTKKQPHRVRDYDTDPERWEEFCSYNIGDCVAERGIRKRLWAFRPQEVEWIYYEIDQIINDRGMPVDLDFVRSAINMSDRRKDELSQRMAAITGLNNPGSRNQLLPWIREFGYYFNDLQKDSVTKVLAVHDTRISEGKEGILTGEPIEKVVLSEEEGKKRGLSVGGVYYVPACEEVLRLRQWQARLSVSKYDALLAKCGDDARMRYLFQFCGAGRTARWAGRTVQTQNLARTPESLEDVSTLTAATNIIRSGDYEMLEMFMPEPMEALVGCLRGAFATKPGEELTVCDLSSIETVVIAWLTGCTRLLDVIKSKRNPYIDFATVMFKKSYDEVTKFEKQQAKPGLLGCGYRLGGGEMYDGKRTGLWGYAEGMGVDMSRAEAHAAVKAYRSTYVEIPEAWPMLEKAMARCMDTGQPTTCGFLRFERRKPYLMMFLPTGRPIHYFQPKMQIETVNSGRMVTKIAKTQEDYFMYGARPGEEYEIEETYQRRGFSYMGKHQKTNQWVRIPSHGGRTIEQATQGLARDIFARGMRKAHEAKFFLRGHSHDELIATNRIGDNSRTLSALRECMIAPHDDLPGLPLNAAGYVSPFYRKD